MKMSVIAGARLGGFAGSRECDFGSGEGSPGGIMEDTVPDREGRGLLLRARGHTQRKQSREDKKAE